LLDTYEPERSPHVRTIIERAVNLGRIIQTTDRSVAGMRDAQLRRAKDSEDDRLSPVDAMPPMSGGAFGAAPPAGELFPQPRVRLPSGELVLLDNALGDRFAVVVAADSPPELVAA